MKSISDTHISPEHPLPSEMGSACALTRLPGPDPWARSRAPSRSEHPWVGIRWASLRRCQGEIAKCRIHTVVFLHSTINSSSHIFFRRATNESHLSEQLVFLGLEDSGTNPAILTPAAIPLLPAGRSFCLEIPNNSGVCPGSCDCYSHLSSLSNPTQSNAGLWSSLMLYMGSFLQVTEQSG